MFAYALQTALVPLASVTQHCDVKILFFALSFLLVCTYLMQLSMFGMLYFGSLSSQLQGVVFVVSTHGEQIECLFETLRHVYELDI